MNLKFNLSAILVFGLATALYAQDTTSYPILKPLSNFEDKNPVFKLNEEQRVNKNRFLRYFALTGYREGVTPIRGQFNSNFKAQIDTVNGTHRIKMYNLSIEDMLTHGISLNGVSATVVLEVRDPSKFRYDPAYGDKENWLRKNGYCFEVMMPIGVIKSMDIVNDEICRYFKIKCGYQKRIIKNSSDIKGEKEMDVFVITDAN